MKKIWNRMLTLCLIGCVLAILFTIHTVMTSDTVEVFSPGNSISKYRNLDTGIPLFLQYDSQWAEKEYGSSDMKESGCGPTCLSMVWCGLTGGTKWTPYEVAKMAEREGYYVKGAGTSWELMTEGAREIGLYSEVLTFNANHIIETLKNGHPIICAMGPGDFTTEGHFIVLVGVDEENRILVNDPNSIERSKQSWDVDNLMRQMKNLWVFSTK